MAQFPTVRAGVASQTMPQANADWRSIISGLGTDFAAGQQYGRERGIQQGTQALLGQAGPNTPLGPLAIQLLGLGNDRAANVVSNLAQSQDAMDVRRQALNARGDGNQPRYSLSPTYGTDANGNPVILQVGTDGSVKQSTMPAGVQVSQKPIQLDAGTHFVLLDPVTRQPVGQIPKNVAGAANEKEFGKSVGEARANFGQVEQSASDTLKAIDELKTHPGGYWATGWTSPMGSIPGTDARDFAVRVDQLKGQTFLQAFNSLRGGGQITEAEGKKATDALARLDRGLSQADFNTALDDLRGVIESGLGRARAKAGQNGGQSSPQQPQANDAIDQARAAIARGANRDQVLGRLRQMGIDPAGL